MPAMLGERKAITAPIPFPMTIPRGSYQEANVILESRHHDVSIAGRKRSRCLAQIGHGEVSEWLKEHAWKACSREIVTWVRIPPSPPYFCLCFE